MKYLISVVFLSVLLASCASGKPMVRGTGRPPPKVASDIPDCDSLATRRVNPAYPADAINHKTDGWAAIAYKLKGDGSASDLRLIDSEPPGVFVQAAAAALSQWEFKQGVKHDDCVQIIVFKIG